MEFIFENVMERDEFFKNSECCPGHCGLKEMRQCRPPLDCQKCWEQSGVKYRIKNQPTPDHPVSLMEQYNNNLKEQVFHSYGMLKTGDSLVKTEHGWCIERKKPDRILTTHNPYLKVDDLIPDILPEEHWFDKKVEDYIREVTRGDIQMFMMSGRQCGKSEIHRRMLEKYIDLSIFGALPEKPQIEKVIFNNPATIVFWKDGTKTVVKCQAGDDFNPEKGLAMAICKKIYGEGYWSGVFKKWLPEKKMAPLDVDVKKLNALTKKLHEDLYKAFNIPVSILDKTPSINPYFLFGTKPIQTQGVIKIKHSATEPSEPLKPCEECKHADVHEFDEPCRSCSGNSKFEEKLKKGPSCKDCVYSGFTAAEEPCCGCGQYTNFKPKKEEKHPRIERHGTHWRCPNCAARLHDSVIVGRKELYCPNCGIKLVR